MSKKLLSYFTCRSNTFVFRVQYEFVEIMRKKFETR